jgi:hypothetical protein
VTPGEVMGCVESRPSVQVLLRVAGCMSLYPEDRGLRVAARDQDPRDAVRLVACDLWANPLCHGGATKNLGQAVESILEFNGLGAPGTKHAN